jgi:hypothetical protein
LAERAQNKALKTVELRRARALCGCDLRPKRESERARARERAREREREGGREGGREREREREKDVWTGGPERRS